MADTCKSKSIFLSELPSNFPLEDSPKYAVKCLSCGDKRKKSDTRSLQVYRDPDGFIRFECYNPGCTYNVRHAAVDPEREEKDFKEAIDNSPEIVLPIPFNPEENPTVQKLKLQFSRVHWYRDADGNYLYAILRRKLPDGSKQMYPLTLLETGDWSLKNAPKVNSLYTSEQLVKHKPIIIVEGEKAVDEGQAKFPNSTLVTWPGGVRGIERGDWSRLEHKKILIWPDNDEAGKEAAVKISKMLPSADVSIAYVNHLPHKADLADELSQEDIQLAIENRIPVSVETPMDSEVTLERFKNFLKRDQRGIPTGWGAVDNSIHLRGLTIIEGRSSHGKSTVLFNLADNISKQGRTVLFYSYEMPAEDVLLRLSLLNEDKVLSRIPWENQELYSKKILDDKAEGYKLYAQKLNKTFFLTDEYLSIDNLVKQLSQPAIAGSVIFIDYIQFIPGSEKGYQKPRYLQIKDFAEKLKQVSKKNNLTIVAGAQLTAGDQPAQDVAREGKDIYNAADVVLRIWNRREGEQTANKWNKNDDSDDDGLLIVRKARAGATKRSFNFNFLDTRKMMFTDSARMFKFNKDDEEGDLL